MPLLSEQDSIYSLATNPRGSFLASGSPSKIVRLWDLRQQQPEIARLRGHADNIRALLVSEDGKVVLSASTDATIKLWSTSMQRCLHTFTYHTESVWSLFSNHPDLDIFYSGDRSGLVCKVDLEGCGDMSEGECVLLCKDDDTSTSSGSYGLSEGINSIVATDDAFLWTTTGSSSILRWKDIPPRRQRQTPARPALRNPVNSLLGTSFSHQPLLQVEEQPSPLPTTTDRRGVSFAPDLDDSDADSLHVSPHPNIPMASPSGAATHMRRPSSIKQNSLNQVQPLSPRDPALDNQIDGVPLESLVCFALGMAYSSPFSPQAVMQRQQYAESLASLTSAVHRWPHTPHSQNSFGLSRLSSRNFDSKEEPAQVPPSSAMLAYTHRESASDAVPLRLTPEEVIWGRKGLIRCEQLNEYVYLVMHDVPLNCSQPSNCVDS
jgi:WD repeat-containing protein 48